ncbi:membrane fusion protein (multidrug efflux system) [Rhizomicrobium palustre]|uniref:Membrane fusion protein (Multidrug efflux system) n=1 Tax=Rhizomicrobium palustre TaxID=189966 RepID=A0A846MUE5_9PROT|nr:efflux RND transporter periplasmic adaptor subunit [Rhizomicrobium palustre]NIK86821.1 membrane fusion protein (multidrug efflux system) [Rhizomicrobium palustre]
MWPINFIASKRTSLLGLVLSAPLVLTLAGCGKSAPPGPPTAEVGFVVLKTEPVSLTAELVGRTNAYRTSEVRPQVSGIIKERLFEEGALVQAGQPLYQIDPSLMRAARDQAQGSLASAQASLATAQAKARRYRALRESDAISRQDADDALAAERQAQASVTQAQASLRTAEINLAYTRITAPISGRIGRSTVTQGALVTASQTSALATIQQLDPIFVDITQSSSKMLELRQSLASGGVLPASTQVRLKLENGTDYPLAGVVQFAEQTVDEATGTVTIRARFPNPDGVLLPGMFVRAIMPEAVVPKAILAPQQGITRDAKGAATALVLSADNKVVLKTVTAERAVGDRWLITSGLAAGDRLIVEGVSKAQPGAVVKATVVSLSTGR